MKAPEIAVYGCAPHEQALFQQLAPRYGVTPIITAAAVSERNIDLAFSSRCISVPHKAQVSNATLRALGQAGVRYISTRSIGYDHIDVSCADRLGIVVANVEYSPDSVADYTLLLMLMALRQARSIFSRADAQDYRLGPVLGKELRDLTVGVIGTGRIGAAVIARLRGFGGEVLAHDTRPQALAESVALSELVQRSDIVTLHTPLNAGTHHLLDRRRIALLKPGAWIVNTGRGSLIDTQALVSALESGRLGGAALDVLEGEEGIFYADWRDKPMRSETLRRLQRLPNVLISPHTAYYTEHAVRDIVENTVINCLAFEKENFAWTG